MFDLTIFPLSLETGREQYELPGLLVVSAPRKAARMRAQDQLVLYCKLRTIPGSGAGGSSSGHSRTSLTHGQLREVMSRLAETYYTFSGSVTAGLRVVVARLNDFLLNRNLKSAQEGQTVGTINLAVIHGNRLVVAHAGITHSFVLTKKEVLHFDDSQAGRGLGLSRQVMPRFYQSALEAGDLLILCADPPSSWNTKMLANSPQLSFDHLRRRLSSNAGPELQVGVVRFQPGRGQISYWRPGESARAAGKPSGQASHSSRPFAPAEPVAQNNPPVAPSPVMDMPAELDNALAEPGQVESTPETGASVPAHTLSFAVPERHDEAMVSPKEGVVVQEGVPEGEPSQEAQPESALATVEADAFISSQDFAVAPGQEVPVSPSTLESRQAAHPDYSQEPMRATAQATGHPAARVPGQMETTRRGERYERGKNVPQKAKERRPVAKRSLPRQPGALRTGLAAVGAKIRLAFYRAAQFLIKVTKMASGGLERAIPRQYDAAGRPIPFFNLSPAQMMAVAIFVPLVVVAVGTTVYVRSGLSEQFLERLSVAQSYAQQAAQLTDPVQQREGWKHAYAQLLEADKLGRNDESQALKQQIIQALDDLEGYVRLDYQPAVSGGLPADVSITNIVATSNDIYLLDSSQGRILRLYRTASSYEVDPKFSCGAGTAGTVIINPLIDLVALPANNEMHSTVMGIDSGGNLVYCAPNLTGFDSRPLALPDNGWGNIAGITLYGNTLYVLDPKGNAVYRYDGSDGVFTDRPHLYFDNTIPQMGDVIDLAVDQEFLYMLHADGRMTVCESSGFAFAATRCNDPAPYGDSRPGYEPAPLVFPGSRFVHIQTTEPPDPSLYALDAANRAIYHLSLRRMNLQRQYRSVIDGNFPLPNEEATAFTIAHRRVLIAFRNKVFFASLP